MIINRISLIFFLIFFSHINLFSQNLENINIDQLSDQQLKMYLLSNNLNGLSETELESKANQKGLSKEQIEKLKDRITKISDNPNLKNKIESEITRKNITSEVPKNNSDFINGLPIFGSEIFSKENLTFEPNVNIPTPVNYILGKGDQINIDVFGYSDKVQSFIISPDGDIRISNIGPVKIAGLKIEEARVKLINELGKLYPGLKSGNTNLQLTLGKIRSIRVNIIGEIKRPGTYTISSLSTIANALYAAGGPTSLGSYRNIELVRSGKVIANFDLYQYLFYGDLTENKLLQDDDVIKISTYLSRVEIRGALKRNAIFDLKNDEKLSTLITYAGGLSNNAKKGIIKIIRYGFESKEVITVEEDQIQSFQLKTGDKVFIDSISENFSNRILITGAIKFPGAYSISSTPDIKKLIEKTKLEEDAYLDRIYIQRLGDNYQKEIVSIDLNKIINGQSNFKLKREDSIHVFKIRDLLPEYTIQIDGEVKNPSTYPFASNLKVQDVILMAGGLKDGAIKKHIEVSRRIRDSATSDSFTYSKVYNIDIDQINEIDEIEHSLEPFDIIQVRKLPNYRSQGKFFIDGEVNFPGTYIIQGVNERISDAIKRAGGLKTGASSEDALMLRKTFEAAKNSLVLQEKVNVLRSTILDTTKATLPDSLLSVDRKRVNINLKKIIENPGSYYDLNLNDGDLISIPQKLQTVQTFNGVYFPKKIIYRTGLSFKKVLNESGGVLPNAKLGKSYVLYPNGQIKSTRHFLIFKIYPKIVSGSEVYVPVKKDEKKISTGEILGFTSVISSLMSIIYLITK